MKMHFRSKSGITGRKKRKKRGGDKTNLRGNGAYAMEFDNVLNLNNERYLTFRVRKIRIM